MNRYIFIILTILALAAIVIIAGCSNKQETSPTATSSKTTVSAVCPVMGTKIPDITKAAGKSVYKGKTYYFCCDTCKPEFDKKPEKYVK